MLRRWGLLALAATDMAHQGCGAACAAAPRVGTLAARRVGRWGAGAGIWAAPTAAVLLSCILCQCEMQLVLCAVISGSPWGAAFSGAARRAGAAWGCALTCWYPPQYGRLLDPYLHAPPRRSLPPSPRTSATGASDGGSDGGTPPGAERLRDKWWSDSDEPLYLAVTPAAVLEGRPCDADDHVRWLLAQGEYAAAVAAAAAAPYVRPETWQACAAVYVEHLLATGDVDGAASPCAACCVLCGMAG